MDPRSLKVEKIKCHIEPVNRQGFKDWMGAIFNRAILDRTINDNDVIFLEQIETKISLEKMLREAITAKTNVSEIKAKLLKIREEGPQKAIQECLHEWKQSLIVWEKCLKKLELELIIKDYSPKDSAPYDPSDEASFVKYKSVFEELNQMLIKSCQEQKREEIKEQKKLSHGLFSRFSLFCNASTSLNNEVLKAVRPHIIMPMRAHSKW